MKLSTFNNYTSTTPKECGMEEIVRLIREDTSVKTLTEGYRATGNRRLKESSPCFVPACRFEGGKQRGNVTGLTGLSMADFDHIAPERIGELRSKVNADAHTYMSYVTISGNGLRVIYRYELDESAALEDNIRFYRKAFMAGNEYFSTLLCIESDGQCKNITRLSGMCHDADVFFRPDAMPFTAQWIGEREALVEKRRKEESRIRRTSARLDRIFESTIAPELESEGAVFAPGSHNDFIMRMGYRLNQLGVPLDSVLPWAAVRFAGYDGTEQVIRSCYQRTEEFGSRRRVRSSPSSDRKDFASVEEIKEFLDSRIKMRFNVITSRVEYLSLTDK